jgi:hypothetical protein
MPPLWQFVTSAMSPSEQKGTQFFVVLHTESDGVKYDARG